MNEYHGKTALEVLTDYRMAVLELDALKRQYDRLLFLGAPNGLSGAGDASGVGGTNDRTASRIQQQDGILERIEAIEAEKLALIGDFEDVLAQVHSGKLLTILRYYYGLGYSDYTCADEMGMERMQVWRGRRKIVEILSGTEP